VQIFRGDNDLAKMQANDVKTVAMPLYRQRLWLTDRYFKVRQGLTSTKSILPLRPTDAARTGIGDAKMLLQRRAVG
jgi:hypothetical protein